MLFDESHFKGMVDTDDVLKNYVYRLYFSTISGLTVGYGDITPKSIVCKMLIMVQCAILFGITML